MNYACMTKRAFETKGKVVTHKKKSEGFRKRQEIFTALNFVIHSDPSDTSCRVEMQKVKEN